MMEQNPKVLNVKFGILLEVGWEQPIGLENRLTESYMKDVRSIYKMDTYGQPRAAIDFILHYITLGHWLKHPAGSDKYLGGEDEPHDK